MISTRTIRLMLGLAVVAAAPALAQNKTINWNQDANKAVAEAKASRKPLMFWIVSRSDDRPEDVERDQKRAFADATVFELSQRFVASKLSRSVHKELLDKWGMSQGTNLEIVFATPEGDRIDNLSPGGVAKAESLAAKMSLVLKNYRQRLFDTEVRKIFDNEKATAAELKKALDTVDTFVITTGDGAVIAVAKRSAVDPAVLAKCYSVLSTLSTKPSTDFLFEAAATDKKALDALTKCTPEAAEQLLSKLGGESAAGHIRAYTAVCKICKIRDPKPDGFWGGQNEKILNDEIERVRKIVRSTAEKWRERIGQYR